MNSEPNDKHEYIQRLQRFHERPHGRKLNALVLTFIKAMKKAVLTGCSKTPSDEGNTLPLQTDLNTGKPSLLVLEIGCGIGTLAKQIVDTDDHVRIVATDPNYSVDAQRLNADMRIAYRRAWIPCDCQYDAIVCMNVLGHMENPQEQLYYMAQSVKCGGLVMVSIPSRLYEQVKSVENRLTGYSSDPTLKHRWYDWQLVAFVETLGLQLIAKQDVSLKGLLCESTFFVFRK